MNEFIQLQLGIGSVTVNVQYKVNKLLLILKINKYRK